MKCKISSWGCIYHACMSDDCKKAIVIENMPEIEKEWGKGRCKEKTETSNNQINKQKMYYKIEKGTETFRKLAELRIKMKEVSETTKALVTKLGGSDRYFLGYRAVAGGIRGIMFYEKPENWRRVQDNFYLPKSCKQNKEILDEIKALPVVSFDELNETVGFEEHFVGLTHHIAPGITFGETFHLMQTNDNCNYTAPADCIEILASEYKKLSLEIE